MSKQKTEHKRLLWLPNAITSLRYIFAIAVFTTALSHLWRLSLLFVLIAIGTDFLDGFAAKKLHAQTPLGAELDKLADLILVLAGLFSLAATGHIAWLLIVATTACVIWGETMPVPLWWPSKIVSVTYLFVAWIAIVWYYIDFSFGWSWVYIPMTAGVLVICAYFKQHRIRAWLQNQG